MLPHRRRKTPGSLSRPCHLSRAFRLRSRCGLRWSRAEHGAKQKCRQICQLSRVGNLFEEARTLRLISRKTSHRQAGALFSCGGLLGCDLHAPKRHRERGRFQWNIAHQGASSTHPPLYRERHCALRRRRSRHPRFVTRYRYAALRGVEYQNPTSSRRRRPR